MYTLFYEAVHPMKWWKLLLSPNILISTNETVVQSVNGKTQLPKVRHWCFQLMMSTPLLCRPLTLPSCDWTWLLANRDIRALLSRPKVSLYVHAWSRFNIQIETKAIPAQNICWSVPALKYHITHLFYA